MLGYEGNICQNTCSVFIKMQTMIFQPTIARSLPDKKKRWDIQTLSYQNASKNNFNPLLRGPFQIKTRWEHSVRNRFRRGRICMQHESKTHMVKHQPIFWSGIMHSYNIYIFTGKPNNQIYDQTQNQIMTYILKSKPINYLHDQRQSN